MKTKLAQLIVFVNRIDRRYIQFAGFLVVLGVSFFIQSPADGSVGPS